jgi:4-hydroxy-tetrahydrodipicolinate reductase
VNGAAAAVSGGLAGEGGSTTYKVVQWATGNIGARALRGVIEHPDMTLAGLYVFSPDKSGRDAGEICGLQPTGILATREIDEILRLEADCVLYMPRALNTGDVCRLLASGVNVVTTRGEFHHPPSMDPDLRELVESACRRGGTSIHSTGSSPGFISEAVPLVLTSIQRRIESLVIEEYADLSKRNSPELLFDLMGFGSDPTTFDHSRWSHGVQSFGPSLRLVGDALSLPLDSVEGSGEVAVARRTVEMAAGRLEAGTVAGQRMRVTGMRGGRPLLSFVATWFCTPELEPEWVLRPTGWRISVVGDAPLDVEMRFAVPLEQMGAWTPGYTANRAVNAVPFVCQAAPGIRTTVDLPQIIGTLGEGHPTFDPGDGTGVGPDAGVDGARGEAT